MDFLFKIIFSDQSDAFKQKLFICLKQRNDIFIYKDKFPQYVEFEVNMPTNIRGEDEEKKQEINAVKKLRNFFKNNNLDYESLIFERKL